MIFFGSGPRCDCAGGIFCGDANGVETAEMTPEAEESILSGLC